MSIAPAFITHEEVRKLRLRSLVSEYLSMAEGPPFRLQERDLDLILLEELHAANGFDGWFAERIGLEGFAHRRAEHSVSAKVNAKWGETDVLALLSKNDETVAVLIEDKIAASFTERQAARYHERASELVKEGIASRYLTVLIGPAVYLAVVPADDKWDRTLPIEDLRDWFARRPTSHAKWRASALESCLARMRHAPARGQEDVIRFSQQLSIYLEKHHGPTLAYNPGRDTSGPTIRFPGASSNKTLWWKLATNQITLQLMGPLQGRIVDMALPEGVDCELATNFGRKCDYLTADLPPLDLTIPLAAQEDVVETAAAAAYRLIALLPEIEVRAGLRVGDTTA